MKKTELQKDKWQASVEERFKKINLVLQKVIPDFAPDDIHDFRVEVKKLKALLKLFSSASENPSIFLFPKRLNKVYKTLGHLREWQIQKQKIDRSRSEKNYPGHLPYLNKIDVKTELYKLKAVDLIWDLPSFVQNKEQIKNCCPDKGLTATISAFFHSKMEIIHNMLLSGKRDDESMHEMRKLLKDVQYVLSEAEKKGEPVEGFSRLKTIQKVSGQLGEFHDLYVALALLDRELEDLHNNGKEKDQLQPIQQDWRSEKEKLRQQVMQLLQEMDQRNFPDPAPVS